MATKKTHKVDIPTIHKNTSNMVKSSANKVVVGIVGEKDSIKAAKQKINPTSPKLTSIQKIRATSNDFTIIKKSFEKVDLISHKLTLPNDVPLKVKTNNISVSEINGIGGATYLKFHSEGVRTVEDFAKAGVSKISQILGWTEKGGLPFYLRGLSV